MDKITATPIRNIFEALKVRSIRNECRHNMTNNSSMISIISQFLWYFRIYRPEHKKGNMICLLVKENNKGIGFGFIRKNTRKYWITGGLKSQMRGKGLGLFLFQSILKCVPSNEVWLEVLESNTVARSIYNKLGFKKVKLIKLNGKETIVMNLLNNHK